MTKWLDINVLLKCWLVFVVGFAIAGYAVESAIVLGLLGGLTGGFIASWWKITTALKSDDRHGVKSEPAEKPDSETIIHSVRKFRERIEGQLGIRNEKTTSSRSKGPRMGWFGIQDPRRHRTRR